MAATGSSGIWPISGMQVSLDQFVPLGVRVAYRWGRASDGVDGDNEWTGTMKGIGALTAEPPIKRSVIVQDRAPLFGQGLGLLLESASDIRAVWVASPEELEARVSADDGTIAVVIEAAGVPWDVEHLVSRLRRARGSVRIVGTYPSAPSRHGAIPEVVYISRGAPSQVLGTAVMGKAAGGSPDDHRPGEGTPRRAESLTRREFQVLALISAGMTTAEIAGRLGISAKTVEGKRQTLYSKLNVQNQSAAVAVAIRSGLLGPGVPQPVVIADTTAAGPSPRNTPAYKRPSMRVSRLTTGLSKVVVLHDLALVAETIKHLLSGTAEVVAETRSGKAAVALSELLVPDVVVMGDMVFDGVPEYYVPALLQTGARVLLVSDNYDILRLLEWVELGVTGIVGYDQPPRDLADAVMILGSGGAALPPRVVATIATDWRRGRQKKTEQPGGENLTSREFEVLGAMSDGLSTKAVAHHLGISLKTVESHKTRIFGKLGVRTQAQAIALVAGRDGHPGHGSTDTVRSPP
jgi:DNA-binding NarL/FixJ family response regulator